jgi:APA family basic amino acid/polyamine antiporter
MESHLNKKYGLFVALSMVVGIVIGIGIFFKAEVILNEAGGNPKIALLAWFVGGIITIFSGLTIAEISAAIPETGGIVAYADKIYGRFFSYIIGWSLCVLYMPAIEAIIVYYFSIFLLNFLGIEANVQLMIFISFGTLTMVCFINMFTKKAGGIIQIVSTTAKMIPIILIIIYGFSKGNMLHITLNSYKMAGMGPNKPFLLLFGKALVPVMFAFDGWIYVSSISGELKNLKKDLPRSIIWGLSIITLVYLLFNTAMLAVFPVNKIIDQGIFGVALYLFGEKGAKFIFAGIVISAFGGLNGFVIASPRIPYSLALENKFPCKNIIGKVNTKYDQPINASILMYVLSCIYLTLIFITRNPNVFGDIPVAVFWIYYSFLFMGVIILRKKEPDIERPYKVPCYPVIPLLATISGIIIAVYAAISNPMYMLISGLLIAAGLVFYRKDKHC